MKNNFRHWSIYYLLNSIFFEKNKDYTESKLIEYWRKEMDDGTDPKVKRARISNAEESLPNNVEIDSRAGLRSRPIIRGGTFVWQEMFLWVPMGPIFISYMHLANCLHGILSERA